MQDRNIKVIGASKFFGKTQALCDVNMECAQGEIVGIIGRNGAGKTVLFKAICSLLSLDSGEIQIHDRAKTKRRAALLERTGILFTPHSFDFNRPIRTRLDNFQRLIAEFAKRNQIV